MHHEHNNGSQTILSSHGTSIEEVLKRQKKFFNSLVPYNREFRLLHLEKLKRAMQNCEGDLIQALNEDLGKPKFEAYASEIGLVYEEINLALKNLKSWMEVKKESTPLFLLPAKSYVQPTPLGQVFIIGPWNYPVQLILAPMVGAIAAGNTVVLKPSEFAPHTNAVLRKIIHQSFDENTVAFFEGGVKTNAYLLEKNWDHVFFTGSTQVGRIVAQACAKNLVPYTLELGGKSPCLVEKSADLDKTAKRIVWSKFLNCGQTCVAPDYILVETEIKPLFVGKLVREIEIQFAKNSKDKARNGRIINQKNFDRLLHLLEGQHIIHGGKSYPEELYIEPTLINEPSRQSPLMQEEIFGPILPILSVSSIEDAMLELQDRDKPLALYLFTSNQQIEDKIMQHLRFGGGHVNDCLVHVSNPHLGFGGVGKSGQGQYHGYYSFKLFSHFKSIMKNQFLFDLPVRYGPPAPWKDKAVRTIMK